MAPPSSDPFASGREPTDDHALTAAHPDDPAVIDTFVVWLHDKARNLGVELRIHAHDGEAQGRAVVFLPDGRILSGGPDPAPILRSDAPETAHVRYHCIEPFRRWAYQLRDFPLTTSSDAEHATGDVSHGATVRVSLDVEATTVAPIWLQGSLLPEAAEAMKGPAGLWIAGRLTAGMSRSAFRYDQAISATGTIVVDRTAHEFNAHGLRGHVRGVRILEGFKAHTWIGAVFPESGRAVGLQCHMRHGASGGYAFSEAYVWDGETVHPNRIIYAPPVNRDDPRADFVVEVACDSLGLTRLTGRDDRTVWTSMGLGGLGELGSRPMGAAAAAAGALGLRPDAARVMSQSLASFECDGEPGYGMCERSG